MSVKIGINGFGRIGRQSSIYRQLMSILLRPAPQTQTPSRKAFAMAKSFSVCLFSILLMSECAHNSNSPTGSVPPANTVAIGTFLLDSEVNYLSGYRTYAYNAQGKKSKYSVYDQNSVVLWRDVYQYDSREFLIKEIDSTFQNPSWPGSSAPTQWITVYQYDASGWLVGELFYNDSAKLSSFARYENNQFGSMVKYTEYGLDSVPTYWCTWRYDSRDSILGTVQYNADSSLQQFDTYEYNKWGVQRYVLYHPDSTIEATAVMGYDSSGRMITESVTAGSISQSFTFDYDSNGNMASSNSCDAYGSCHVEDAFFYKQYLGQALNKRAAFEKPAVSSAVLDWKAFFQRRPGTGLNKRIFHNVSPAQRH